MRNDETWQIYKNNGQPVKGFGASMDEMSNNHEMIRGNAHVWIWRENYDEIEILLTRQSYQKNDSPGMFHISAGGHINLGECSAHTAVRETKEELGLEIDINELVFVSTIRIVQKNPNDIVHVYLYQLKKNIEFEFLDGEVEEVVWVLIEEFKKMVCYPKKNNLIMQGDLYFETLLRFLNYLTTNKLL